MTNTMKAMTNGTAREQAMLLDEFEAAGVTRLTEDENPWFTGGGDWTTDFDEDEDFFWGLSVHNNG